MNTPEGKTLVWFDTEYTTLDLEQAHLLQVAMVVTDIQGHRIGSPDLDLVTPVRLPPGTPVSDFVAKECPDLVTLARSSSAPTPAETDRLLCERLETLLGPVPTKIKNRPVLAGNTIHADWWMARRHLPLFINRLHYRNLDVSSLKLLWLQAGIGPEFDKENTALMQANLPGFTLPPNTKRHDALYDVLCSIAELNFYRKNFVVQAAQP